MKNHKELDELELKYAEISNTKRKIRQSFAGKISVSRGQNKRRFEEMRLDVLRELRPRSKIQNILVEKFILALANLEKGHFSLTQILTKQNVDQYRKDLQENGGIMMQHEVDSWMGRMRKIKAMNFADPEAQSVLKYIISQEKNVLKLLEQIRVEQAMNPRKSTDK